MEHYTHYDVEQADLHYQQSKALVKGVIRGFKELGQLVAHPLDNFVYPVSQLAYDSLIITLERQSRKNNHPSLYKSMREKNPQVYTESSRRMQERVENVKTSSKDFYAAPLESQIESLSSFGTTILVPMGLLKGISYARNVKKFGTGNPPEFHPIEKVSLDKAVKNYQVQDLRALKGYNDLIYVYTVDNELLITPTFQKTFNKKLFDPRTADPSGGFTLQVLHPQLAKLRPVYAAGEVIVDNGRIIELTNFSGHYQPAGAHLSTTVQNAFLKAGYGEVTPKIYTEFFSYDRATIAVTKPLPGLGAGVGASLATNADLAPADEMEEEDYIYPKHLREYLERPEARQATRAYHDLVLLSQDFALEKPEVKVNLQERLLKIAQPLQEFGALGSNAAQLALTLGGHKRTWNGVAKVSQGALTMASSLTTLASAAAAGSLLSLGALTGGIGLAIGAIGLIGGFFGDDDDDEGGNEALAEALQQIHQSVLNMHQAMLDCFQRVEEILVFSLLGKLNQINSNLSRLERITAQSFKELHTKDLVDICDALQKEIAGEHPLSQDEKRRYLRQLSCWIDNHSASSLQTQMIRKDGDVSKVIEVLAETNLEESLLLFLLQMSELFPTLELKSVVVPNLKVLAIACEIYMIASRRPGYFNNPETIKRAQRIFAGVEEIKNTLRDFSYCGESLVDLLRRQYDNYRYWTGQLICVARQGADWSSVGTSLYSCLAEGPHKTNLLDTLDQMDLRRVCLIKLGELLEIEVPALESKEELLNREAQCYAQKAFVANYDTKVLKQTFAMGCNPNQWDSWGQPIHCLTKYDGQVLNLHLLFKMHSSVTIELSGRTRYDRGDTWGCGSSPILHAMNLGRYAMGVLFCAQGYDIRETDGRCGSSIPFNSTDMGNAYWWVDSGGVSSIVNTRLVRAMNSPGNLNREQLRLAYAFYKHTEAGSFTSEVPEFSSDSLLLLTCVLGDLLPLKYYLRQRRTILTPEFLNRLIEVINISYLQFAKACQQPLVVAYLEECGALDNLEGALNVTSLYGAAIEGGGMEEVKPHLWELNAYGGNNLIAPAPRREEEEATRLQARMTHYLEASAEEVLNSSSLPEECLIFRDLLGEVIEAIPRKHKFYAIITKNFKTLQAGIESGQTKDVRVAFNTLNAVLSTVKDLATPYLLRESINNLVQDLPLPH